MNYSSDKYISEANINTNMRLFTLVEDSKSVCVIPFKKFSHDTVGAHDNVKGTMGFQTDSFSFFFPLTYF